MTLAPQSAGMRGLTAGPKSSAAMAGGSHSDTSAVARFHADRATAVRPAGEPGWRSPALMTLRTAAATANAASSAAQ